MQVCCCRACPKQPKTSPKKPEQLSDAGKARNCMLRRAQNSPRQAQDRTEQPKTGPKQPKTGPRKAPRETRDRPETARYQRCLAFCRCAGAEQTQNSPRQAQNSPEQLSDAGKARNSMLRRAQNSPRQAQNSPRQVQDTLRERPETAQNDQIPAVFCSLQCAGAEHVPSSCLTQEKRETACYGVRKSAGLRAEVRPGQSSKSIHA